ncbi:MAG: response regulator, partial [Alphaproteobacteria bacterium]|nr:response regulator [Alphaproteobacteria bacterium]
MAHILVADDDTTLRDLVQRALESDGHAIDVVGDGSAALGHIQSGAAIDVLVADIDMPVIDGISLAKQALAVVPALRILMISGMTERLEAAKDIPAQKLAVLQKPFTLEAVRAEVKAL